MHLLLYSFLTLEGKTRVRHYKVLCFLWIVIKTLDFVLYRLSDHAEPNTHVVEVGRQAEVSKDPAL